MILPTEAKCIVCACTVTDHDDAGACSLAYCGDCGKPTCADHRADDATQRCTNCEAGRDGCYRGNTTTTKEPDMTTTYCTACGVTYGRGHDEEDCVCGAPYRLAVTVTADWEAQALSIGSEYLPTAARKVRDGARLTPAERQAYAAWVADQLAAADE